VPLNEPSRPNRRAFLRQTSLLTAAGLASKAFAASTAAVSLVLDPADATASTAPVAWAVTELEQALHAHGIAVRRHAALAAVPPANVCVVVAGSRSPLARGILAGARVRMPQAPESLAIVPGKTVPGKAPGRSVLLACGSDPRGLVYALLELADRVTLGDAPIAALHPAQAIVEQPANRVRSVNRAFVSDVEDKPWLHDRSMWPAYLTMLAGQRFNRFSLTLGLGYDYPNPVLDSYLYFAYPFLVQVPGYEVRAAGLPDQERDQNLAMLRLISDEAAARGLDFQLGLWTHAYEFSKGSHPNYLIEGLTPETHAPYCRDALVTLLRACPNITGITLRVHGESGIPEENFAFWQTLVSGLSRCGRTIELNLHAKGMTQRMIDIALSSGMPVTLASKYWAEHNGLSYQPASIRKMEMPPKGKTKPGLFYLSEGSRRFLRYSYGDLLKKNRRYSLFFRIFPGTQRALLWGDPEMAASDARAMSFCGATGVDLFEPLSFKGRHGSGLPGGRCAYADASLTPHFDWQKFLYTYRVWGRSIYNPSTDPEGWRRLLRRQLRQAAPSAAEALAHASRILRLVTTSQTPSAANNFYWPEMYTNMPMVDASLNTTYPDTLAPKVYTNVSPLDPELFSQINEFAQERLSGHSSGKYSPLDVATWLEELSSTAQRHLAHARAQTSDADAPEFRRLAVDVTLQCALGNFFATKLRSGVLFALYQQTGNRAALEQSLAAYRRARSYWVEAARASEGVYRLDITYGNETNLRGTWSDRLPAMDKDIAAMAALLLHPAPTPAATPSAAATALLRDALAPAHPMHATCRHTPPQQFSPGQPVPLTLTVAAPATVSSVHLYYRQANQGEYYQQVEMQKQGANYTAEIPAAYTNSPYDLEYFFVLQESPTRSTTWPGIAPHLSHQPYFTVPQT